MSSAPADKTLVVQAHPAPASLNVAFLNEVVRQRPQAEVIRLGEHDQLQRATFDGVTEFIAVYPTWWGSLPSTFLAALGEVLGPWIDGPEPRATSPLRTVRALTVVTSHGSSKFVNGLQGEPGRQLWKRTVLPLCHGDATFSWRSLYKLDRATAQDRSRFIAELANL